MTLPKIKLPFPSMMSTPVSVKLMRKYIYGGGISEEEIESNARDLVDAADKYGVVNLKLAAESVYVQSTKITLDNLMDIILYSDAKNCALLKEAAMDFVVENGKEVFAKVSMKDVPGVMFSELLTAFNRGKDVDARSASADFNTMRVSSLR